MLFALSLICADDQHALGRLDYDSLSDQARMEIHISGMAAPAKARVQDPNGGYLDMCDWPCNTCDENGKLIKIAPIKRHIELAGTLRMDFLPQTVKHFTISMKTIQGTIETKFLPPVLEYLDIADNEFFGTLDFKTLPRAMVEFRITNNKFSGGCDLTALPPDLRSLEIADNDFTGDLVLTHLPASLRDFDAGCNHFVGELQLDSLPPLLESLFIDKNHFCGQFRLLNVPEELAEVVASHNSFAKDAVVLGSFAERLSLEDAGVEFVLDENGETHPMEAEILHGNAEQE